MSMTKSKFEMINDYKDIHDEYYQWESWQEEADYLTYAGKRFTKNSEVSMGMIEYARMVCFFELRSSNKFASITIK